VLFAQEEAMSRLFVVLLAIATTAGLWLKSAKIAEAANSGSWANGRFSGYLTIGCNDSYIHAPGGETWFVNLTTQQRRELSTSWSAHYPWSTQFAVLDGVRKDVSRAGFFGRHRRQLDVTRIVSTRWLQRGESTDASMGSGKHRGIVVLGLHGYGFVPLSRSDEMWTVVPGNIGWKELYRPFPEWETKRIGPLSIVDIVGRVGPPGHYDSSNDAVREIAVDEFTYLRPAEPTEVDDTAVLDGVIASINKCIPPSQAQE
jgi:hypothetical protein